MHHPNMSKVNNNQLKIYTIYKSEQQLNRTLIIYFSKNDGRKKVILRFQILYFCLINFKG